MYMLPDDQEVVVAISAVDDQGNPTTMPAGATIAWSASDTSILTVTPDTADNSKAAIVTTGKLGTSQVNVSVTVPGVTNPLTGSLDVQVVPSAPVGISIQPGTTTPRTAPPTSGPTATPTPAPTPPTSPTP